ncbi:hypothetical protein P170DRAFT_478027 [Aspergillus steynii IBT 23096]|uniref:GST C-terminal domain-containing protein n=1 Tax=Aspergillus steynii IBT 23096 TaxID=1392250 RepID=A0A2I2G2Q1_9EURO|nr:uncharacterized protein P170DRAFT_478027 [Aspergillus steynii IBT 23096]PLB47163.1 hypothetical protein P170DRAFT_478027 [Aspergillus steynii IBT 23096]
MNVFPEQPSLIKLDACLGSRDAAAITILLEALHLPYTLSLFTPHPFPPVHHAYFTDILPDGSRVDLNDVLEIASYLIDRYEQERRLVSYKPGTEEDFEVWRWVRLWSEEPLPAAPADQADVVRRMLHRYLLLEQRLQNQRSGGYLVGKKCTMADILYFPAIAAAESLGLDLEMFPELTAWFNRLWGLGAVRRGMEAVRLAIS